MAVTKIYQIKSTLNKAISYITNPEKTNDGELISSYNCQAESAAIEMEITKNFALDVKGDYRKVGGSEVLAHHLIQSFSPEDDVTPELAHELGKQLIDELTEGKFEYVITTHVDQEHIHNHIIFNSVSFYDLKKFRTQPYRTANQIKEISNRICAEHDLSISPKKSQLKDSYKSYSKRRKDTSYRAEIRKRLTMVLQETTSWEDFQEKTAALGVTVFRGQEHLSFQMEGQKRKTRGKSLDDMNSYTEQGISDRLDNNKALKETLETVIEDTFYSSDSLKDFQFLLKQEHGITFKQNKQGSYDFRFHDVSDTKINEILLPDSYHIANFEPYFRESYEFAKDSQLEAIELRYLEKEKSVIVQQDTPVVLAPEQVVKATKEGLLIHLETDETEGLIFIANNYVDVDSETGDYTVWLNDKFDYTVKDIATEEDKDYALKGEGIIRGLETMQGKSPEKIHVAGKNIVSLSKQGVSLAIPNMKIERLFIPSEYVTVDKISQSVTVAIGKNWNYYGSPEQAKESENKKKVPKEKIVGSDLLLGLEKEIPLLDVYIKPKIDALQRRTQRGYTDELLTTLDTIREEKIASPSQLRTQLQKITNQKNEVKEKIKVIDGKIKNYNQVAKLLVTYENYLPIVSKLDDVPRREQKRLEKQYEKEIQQFRFAEKKLIATDNLRSDLTKEKIIEMAKNQTTQRKRLVESYKFYESKLDKIIAVQDTLDQLATQGIFDFREIDREDKEENQERQQAKKREDFER